MANDSATFDGLFPVLPSIDSLILGTGEADVLSAQADGNIVLGFEGDDRLNSTFNLTALIGGDGADTLTTNVIVPPQADTPVHGVAIQLGETGNDDLNATVSLQAGDGLPRGTGQADVLVDGGNGNDVINATANVAHEAFSGIGNATVRTFVIGGGGNDTINALADGGGGHITSIASNTVDGGSGDDHVTVRAETDFFALTGIASNQVFGGSGNDFIDANAIGRSSGQKTVSNEIHGGSGDDFLHALNVTNSNSGAPVGINNLWGDEGNDILKAFHVATGNTISDVTTYLDGGKGGDELIASINATSTNFVHAVIQLEGGDGKDNLVADLSAGPPDISILERFDVANILNGGAGDDQLNANITATLDPLIEGQDPIAAPDLYASSTAENHLDGGAGNDVLVATFSTGFVFPTVPIIGSSFLTGGAGNDQLTVFGGSANILDGGDGQDTLTSGIGDDTMFGGDGRDTLVFAAQNGHDTAHFEQGRDIIDLTALAATNINDFGDLNIKPDGANTVIHFDENNSLTVLGVNDLGAGDFLFG